MTNGPKRGGIPPDPDHRHLFTCCQPGCDVTADEEPLIVTGHLGQMRTYCHVHLLEIVATAGETRR